MDSQKTVYWLVKRYACLALCFVFSFQVIAQADVVKAKLGHRLGVLAQLTLTSQSTPSADQLTRAAILIDQAIKLDPDNAELLRLKLESLEFDNGKAEDIEPLLKKYMSLVPSDDVVQLRYILIHINRVQTVDERLGLLNRFVNSQGLSGPLRARLALMAAQLNREQGNMSEFARFLKLAIKLDPADKNAALQVYSFLVEKNAARVDRFQSLIHLVETDPLDPVTHMMIGDVLLDCGYYEPAARWYAQANTVFNAKGNATKQQAVNLVHHYAIALWGVGRTDQAIKLVEAFVKPAPAEAKDKDEEEEVDQSKADAEDKTEVVIPLELQLLRVALFDAAGNQSQADLVAKEINAQLSTYLKSSDKVETLADVAHVYLLINRNIDQARELIQKIKPDSGLDQQQVNRLKGWLALREKNQDVALEMLQPIQDKDAFAGWGFALAAEDKLKNKAQYWKALFNRTSDPTAKVTIFHQLAEMGEKPVYTETCQAVARVAAGVSPDVMGIASGQSSPLQIRLRPASYRVNYGADFSAVLEIRNATSLPLTLGPGQFLPSRLFIIPQVGIGSDPPFTTGVNVVDVHRALTLAPGQLLRVPIRLDQSQVGNVVWSSPENLMRISFTSILNPVLSEGGSWSAGYPGGMSRTGSINRSGYNVTDERIAGLIEVSSGSPSEQRLSALVALARLAVNPKLVSDAQRETIQKHLNETASGLKPEELAFVVSFLAAEDKNLDKLDKLLHTAATHESDLPHFVLLTTQVRKVGDDRLNAGLRQPNGSALKDFAEAVEADLKAKAKKEKAETSVEPEK